MKVKLLTSNGGFVHEQEIPPFNEYPKVVIWGDRVFQLASNGEYRECFFYILVDESQWQVDQLVPNGDRP